MKNECGYTIKTDDDGQVLYHEYLVDGCNIEPGYEPEHGMFTIEDTVSCATKAEALKAMRQMCKRYYKVTIYDQWCEEDSGCWVSQKITDYRNGKVIGGITM